MAHFLIVAVIFLAAWTILACLLGPLVGRRLRKTSGRTR